MPSRFAVLRDPPLHSQTFADLVAAGYNRIPLVKVLHCPAHTAWSDIWDDTTLTEQIKVFLESRSSREDGRYSIAAWQPQLIAYAQHNQFELRGQPLSSTALRQQLTAELAVQHPPPSPSYDFFTGGYMGMFAYEAYGFFHPEWQAPRHCGEAPQLALYQVDHCLVLDHQRSELMLISCGNNYHAQQTKLQEMEASLQQSATSTELHPPACTEPLPPASHPSYRSSFTKDAYLAGVHQVQEYIRAGETYQTNLTQILEVKTDIPPLSYHKQLQQLHPAPFAGFLTCKGYHLISASPERLLACTRSGQLTMRPIAGTRRRGRDHDEDARLAQELSSCPKERAEHAMLVDLVRNDMARISTTGSVSVSRQFETILYSHVMHLESVVHSQKRRKVDPFTALASVFPGGTISGVPKKRTVEILQQLEPVARGAYTGSLGYIDYDGAFDFNICIRSVSAQQHTYRIGVGAGIVIDSIPEREHMETMNKARGQLQAMSSRAREEQR